MFRTAMLRIFLFLIGLTTAYCPILAQENLYDILGLDMVDTSDYEGKLMFYEDLPFNLLNKAEVDKHVEHDVQKVNSSHHRTLGEVSANLAKNKTSEYQKVRAIFRWIETNIEFDTHSYQTGHFPPQHPLVVYQSKRALSKGMADLFTILCQNNDIECRSLKGYTKGFDASKEKKGNPGSYWNVVRIDGYWYLLDISMCAGKFVEGKYVKNYTEEYFLPPPTEFIKTHLPGHASWQLLENHVALEDFYP